MNLTLFVILPLVGECSVGQIGLVDQHKAVGQTVPAVDQRKVAERTALAVAQHKVAEYIGPAAVGQRKVAGRIAVADQRTAAGHTGVGRRIAAAEQIELGSVEVAQTVEEVVADVIYKPHQV